MLNAAKDGLHREEIDLGDGIEFVVVTLRAAHRGGEEGGAGGVDHVAEFVLPLHLVEERILPLHPVPRSCDDEAGGGILTEGIAGELLEDEAVVGLVFIERADDIIAIVVGVGTLVIGLEAVRIRVADHVEPVPRPTLAEVGTVEETVGEGRDGAIHMGGICTLGPGVLEELPGGLFVGEEPRHIEGHAPQEQARLGGRIEGEAFLLQFLLDEGVDGMGVTRRGHGRLHDGLVGPMIGRLFFQLGLRGTPVAGLVDPGPEARDFLRRQRITLGRHAVGFVGRGDKGNQITLPTFPRHDRFLARITTFERADHGIQAQTALLHLCPVAFETTPFQHGRQFPGVQGA